VGERLLLSDEVRNFLRSLVAIVGHSSRLLGVADTREQVSNLVRVHAGSRYLDGAGPVEIVMAQGECQLFKLELGHTRLVKWHEEVSRTHAALGAFNGHQEEVKLIVATCSRRALDQVPVNDATTRWVVQSVLTVNNEERLNDPLVNDEKSDLWLSRCCVVHFVESSLELNNFAINDLSALSSTHTVTVDDDVSGEVVLVALSEYFHRSLDDFLDLACYDLLTLLLHDEVRVVL